MNNFASIDEALLAKVSGAGTDASGKVTLPTGVQAEGAVKVTDDPVRVYGTTELLACKQQAADNFGSWYQSGERLDRELANCDKQFGKP